MHTTVTRKRVDRTEQRIAIIMMVLLGVLMIAALVSADRDAARTEGSNLPAALESGANVLPKPVSGWLSYEQMRFVEMNQLPEASKVPIPNLDRQQRIEANRRPVARVVAPMSADRMRFIESNMLPESGTAHVAPYGDRLGERY